MSTDSELLVLVGILETEHSEVRSALDKVDLAVEDEDAAALRNALESGSPVLREGLDAHSVAEDDRLFPAISGAIGGGVVEVFVEEHNRIRSLRDQIFAAFARGDADFDRSGEFSELLRGHIDREEAMLFPSAREILSQ